LYCQLKSYHIPLKSDTERRTRSGLWYSNCAFVFYKSGALMIYTFTYECYLPFFIHLFAFIFVLFSFQS
jgi:hypothetical protein